MISPTWLLSSYKYRDITRSLWKTNIIIIININSKINLKIITIDFIIITNTTSIMIIIRDSILVPDAELHWTCNHSTLLEAGA
jgi:hypothetical protein